ncbi:MAG: 50S ribosomal protein L18 [Candidatus Omnitrophica bacterium CG1_02_49_10]|nr:MAG: 50S ribosomal protein L18 [Candidatus Omnitrophica bacterium CG1_02_49_10]
MSRAIIANMKERSRKSRHARVRKKVSGTNDKPRLCVNRSLSHFYASLIDDLKGITLFSLSTTASKVKSKSKYGGNKKAAALLGSIFAEGALKKGYKEVTFDRAGHAFHGRVKEFADAARKGGLSF